MISSEATVWWCLTWVWSRLVLWLYLSHRFQTSFFRFLVSSFVSCHWESSSHFTSSLFFSGRPAPASRISLFARPSCFLCFQLISNSGWLYSWPLWFLLTHVLDSNFPAIIFKRYAPTLFYPITTFAPIKAIFSQPFSAVIQHDSTFINSFARDLSQLWSLQYAFSS